MWHVELVAEAGYVVASASIDTNELSMEDVAAFNWILQDGDSIHITKED